VGLAKLRPDLATNRENAKKMLQRSKLSIAQDYKEHSKDRLEELKQLTVIPTLQRFGIIIVEFRAENKGRTLTHQHLFMMDEELLTDEKGAFIRSTVSNIPIADWAALLKESWGPIKITHVGWLLGGQEAIYTL